MLSCRSAESKTSDCRVLYSFPKAESISLAQETDLRKSPDQHVTALYTSQQSTSIVKSPLTASFDAETKLVASIPTTTTAANAVAASDSNAIDCNPIDGAAGLMIANPGDTAPNSAAVLSQGNKACALQRYYPLLLGGCNNKRTEVLVGRAAQAGTSCAPEVCHSNQGQKGDSSAPKQQLAAIQTAKMQPCTEKLQTLDMFDEAERCRHRQASKAALQALAIQENQLLWAAKTKVDEERSVSSWTSGTAGPSLS